MVEDRSIESLTNKLRSLKVRVAQVESQLREIRGQEEEVIETPPANTPLTRGDRRRIMNKVKRPANWLTRWDERDIENERRAMVTHWVRDQVWIITDNGTKT